jgi:hypothetical protein
MLTFMMAALMLTFAMAMIALNRSFVDIFFLIHFSFFYILPFIETLPQIPHMKVFNEF